MTITSEDVYKLAPFVRTLGVEFTELTSAVVNAVNIPVIASGGAGAVEHFVEVFRQGRADAALAASVFHLGITSIGDLKQDLLAAGIPMRWPC